jgi:tetratricopeptide (TPR) repeat protein
MSASGTDSRSVGRAAVHAALGAAVDAAVDGRGRLLLVTGEAGIGKTTAAQDIAERARARGARVVWAACWPDERVEHGPWRTVLGELGEPGAAAAQSLFAADEQDPSAAVAARTAAYEAAIAALVEACAAAPLVVVLDDLHWADDGTIRLLTALRGRLPSLPLVVAGTYRDEEVVADSPLLALAPLADRVALTPLTPREVESLVTSVMGAPPEPDTLEQVLHRTGGNPFLVVQVGRLLAAGADDSLPAGARDVLHKRLAALPDDLVGVLQAAAVLGGPFSIALLADIEERDPAAVHDALDRAAVARVVVPGHAPGEWLFVHDLFRVAALDMLSAPAAAALHGRAAEVLIANAAEPSTIAHHLLAAATGPDDDAARWSLSAAEAALNVMAWEAAADHAARALSVLPSAAASDGRRGEAWLLLGRARLLSGETDDAVAAFTTAAALARSTGSVELLARSALGFSADLGGFEVRLFDQRQIDLLEEAATALVQANVPALRARVLARLSVALSFAAPTERRLALAEQAVALARSIGDTVVLAGALAAHCDAVAGPADSKRRLAESTEIIELALDTGDGGLELLGRRLRFVALLELGDWSGARDEMRAFGRRADEVSNPLYSWYLSLWRGMFALADGDFATAEHEADLAEAMGQRAGSVNAPMLAAVARAEVFLHAKRNDELEGLLTTIGGVLGELHLAPQSMSSQARVLGAIGRASEAKAILDRLFASGIESLPLDAEWLPAVATLLDVATQQRHPMLESVVEMAVPYSDWIAFEGIGASMDGSVARFLARACTALGRHDEAIDFARRAVVLERAGGTLMLALSEAALAEALEAAAPGQHDATSTSDQAAQSASDAELWRDGDVWHIGYAGRSTIVKHAKGMVDLAALVAQPGREMHVTELEALPSEVARAATASGRDDALDRQAIAAYRGRLEELEEDIAEADAANDLARAERARAERDFLVDELSASVGLGGRARTAGPDPVERLRKAVTARLRDAIRRIDAVHPPLGRHLTNSIRTGTYCSYQPEQPVVWRCEARSGA